MAWLLLTSPAGKAVISAPLSEDLFIEFFMESFREVSLLKMNLLKLHYSFCRNTFMTFPETIF